MINTDIEVKHLIAKYIQKLNPDNFFQAFVRHEIDTPKILGDIWESVGGAVLIDGGWDAFNHVFGRILSPYIRYFSLYHNKI